MRPSPVGDTFAVTNSKIACKHTCERRTRMSQTEQVEKDERERQNQKPIQHTVSIHIRMCTIISMKSTYSAILSIVDPINVIFGLL